MSGSGSGSGRSSVDEEKYGAGAGGGGYGVGDLPKRVIGGRKRRRRFGFGVQVVGVLVMIGITGWWFAFWDTEGFARVRKGMSEQPHPRLSCIYQD
jgi:hypothetical protein